VSNPLLSDFDIAPFEQLKKEIDSIAKNLEEPTFENILETLNFSGKQLDRISDIFFNLNSAETNEEIQKIAQEVSPLLSEFNNDVTLNEELFKRIKFVYDQKNKLFFSIEHRTLLKKRYKGFRRNRANLKESGKKILREIDAELSKLTSVRDKFTSEIAVWYRQDKVLISESFVSLDWYAHSPTKILTKKLVKERCLVCSICDMFLSWSMTVPEITLFLSNSTLQNGVAISSIPCSSRVWSPDGCPLEIRCRRPFCWQYGFCPGRTCHGPFS